MANNSQGRGCGDGRGWHGDSQGHSEAAQQANETTKQRKGEDFFEETGRKGGEASSGGNRSNPNADSDSDFGE